MDERVTVKLLRGGKKDGLCYLPVKVNGSPVRFLVDTGAYHSFVGLKLLQYLGLEGAVDADHQVMATVALRQEDHIEGGATVRVEVVSGFTAEHDFCVSAVGTNILGTDLLRDYDARLQFSEVQDLLALSRRRRRQEVGGQFRVYVPCRVFGSVVRAQLDSGANTTTLQQDVVPEEAIFDGVL